MDDETDPTKRQLFCLPRCLFLFTSLFVRPARCLTLRLRRLTQQQTQSPACGQPGPQPTGPTDGPIPARTRLRPPTCSSDSLVLAHGRTANGRTYSRTASTPASVHVRIRPWPTPSPPVHANAPIRPRSPQSLPIHAYLSPAWVHLRPCLLPPAIPAHGLPHSRPLTAPEGVQPSPPASAVRARQPPLITVARGRRRLSPSKSLSPSPAVVARGRHRPRPNPPTAVAVHVQTRPRPNPFTPTQLYRTMPPLLSVSSHSRLPPDDHPQR